MDESWDRQRRKQIGLLEVEVEIIEGCVTVASWLSVHGRIAMEGTVGRRVR